MRKALLIGINEYPGSPLRGCVNDINAISNRIIKIDGFAMSEVRLLVDGRATTAAIRERLEWLKDGAMPGDRLLLHYSGHGSQITDRDEHGNVTDISDCICPVDFDFSREHAITDDDFMQIFADIPEGVIFNWLSDSCHSGSLARNLPFGCYCTSNKYNVPRSFPIPEDIAWRNATATEQGRRAIGLARSIEHLHGAFISGCRSDQTSADAYIGGKYCGAFTNSFMHVLDKTENVGQSLTEIRRMTIERLRAGGYPQEPQIHGELMDNPWLS